MYTSHFTESIDDVNTVMAPVDGVPDPHYIPKTDVPSDIDVQPGTANLKLTTESDEEERSGNVILAQWWQNLPFVDGLLSCKESFLQLQPAIENYDRQYVQSWWMQYPNAIIRRRGDKDHKTVREEWTYTKDGCKQNSRRLTTRLANYAYQYRQAKLCQEGALANLFIVGRIWGSEATRSLARDCKWSSIQTYCNMYPMSPAPKDSEAYVFGNSGLAKGKSLNMNATIDAFPLWITDIFGNRGCHCLAIDEMLVDNESSNDQPIHVTTLGQDDNKKIAHAIRNATRTITRYGQYNDKEDRPSPVEAFKPSMPRVENGSTIAAVDLQQGSGGKQNTGSAYCHLNFDGVGDLGVGNGYQLKTDSKFTGKLWNNFFFWTEYIHKYFPEMENCESDIYKILVGVLGLFEQSSPLESVLKQVTACTTRDLNSLADNMLYKKNNLVDTATIVKWSPLIWDPSTESEANADAKGLSFSPYVGEVSGSSFTDNEDDYFANNFERYQLFQEDIRTVISKAKEWPLLNPTLFSCRYENHDFYEGPFVHNATPGLGHHYTAPPVQGQNARDRQIAPAGKYAAILDYALTYAYNPKDASLSSYGVTTDTLKRFAATIDNNVFVYTECPDTHFAIQQPLIDTSDLFQCGFNILIGAATKNLSDWERWFTEKENYNSEGKEDPADVDLSAVSWSDILTGKAPCAPVFTKLKSDIAASTITGRAHVVNKAYREFNGYSLVFIGVGIFDHPVATLVNKTSGNYAAIYNVASNAEAKAFIKDLLISWKTSGTSASYNWSTLYYGCTDFMKASADNNSDSQMAVSGILSHGTSPSVNFFTFAPEYGPVTIAVQHVSAIQASITDRIPQFMFDRLVFDIYHPTKGQFRPQNARYDQTASIGSAALANAKNSDTSVNVCLMRYGSYNFLFADISQLIFFIDTLKFRYPHIKDNGFIVLGQAVSFDFSDLSKWIFTMMGRAEATHVGIHDTIGFWKKIERQITAPQIQNGEEFAAYDRMAPARRLTARAKPANSYEQRRSDSKDYDNVISSTTASRADKEPVRKEENPKRRTRNRRGKGKKNFSQSGAKVDNKPSTVDYNRNSVDAPLASAKDTVMDPSTAKEDKRADLANRQPLKADDIANQQ